MRSQAGLGVAILAACACLSRASQGGEAKPTKDAAVKVLQDFYAAFEARDFDKALTFVFVPEKYRKELPKFKEALQQLAGKKEQKEITKKGLAILAKRGKWGKLAEVAGEKEAERLTKDRGLSPASCYGLFAEPRRGAAFTWDGKRFLIIYFNNIGYLAYDRETESSGGKR
jgi:hypothetical protein